MKKIAVACLLVLLIFLVSCGEKTDIWDEVVLGDMLPKPPVNTGNIEDNSAEELWIELDGFSNKQFADYVKQCKEKGFDIDADSSSYSYEAYNGEGYFLSLYFDDSEEELSIELSSPMEMEAITWPTGTAGKKMPVPKSLVGNFSYEYDDSFSVYIGNTSKAEYAEYVNACMEKGFNIDYDKDSDYYYADDKEGWSISVCYEGFNIMCIDIDPPDEDDDYSEEDDESSKPTIDTEDEENSKPVEVVTDEAKPDTSEKETESSISDEGGIDPDFKAAMDSYESFMDEYVAFMKKYSANPSDLSLLIDYADYMKKYADFVEDFEKWEDEDLNTAETAYYIDVQSRVSKKLLEISQ